MSDPSSDRAVTRGSDRDVELDPEDDLDFDDEEMSDAPVRRGRADPSASIEPEPTPDPATAQAEYEARAAAWRARKEERAAAVAAFRSRKEERAAAVAAFQERKRAREEAKENFRARKAENEAAKAAFRERQREREERIQQRREERIAAQVPGGAIRHLSHTFVRLFPTTGGKLEAAGLIAVMALIPVMEMLVIRMFTHLITEGRSVFEADPGKVVGQAAVFFALFGVARVVHHLVRMARVLVFRRRFRMSLADRNRSQESWDWAMSFELSNVFVSFTQAIALSALLLALDHVVGLVNAVVLLATLAAIGWLYSRQIALQRDYVLMGNGEGSKPVAERIWQRISAAEIGALIASLGLVIVLVVVLLRTVSGSSGIANAVVFLLALRILYGQLGTLSSTLMRFARAAARTGV